MKVTQESISKLVADLNGDDRAVAEAASMRLDKLLYPRYPTVTTPGELNRVMEDHDLSLRGSPALEPLLMTLSEGTDFAREYAATVLGAIKEPRALRPIIERLRDDCAKVRYSATQGLWFLRDTQAIDPLVDSLQDSESLVRHGAASALGFIGSEQAVPALIDLYQSGDCDDMVAALYAAMAACLSKDKMMFFS